MIKYSNKLRSTVYETQSGNPYAGSYLKENVLKPSNLSFKTDALTLSSHSYQGNQQDFNLTPRTAQKYQDKSYRQNDAFSKSIHLTPNKQRIRKDHSYIILKNTKDQDTMDSKPDFTASFTTSPREFRTDKTQWALKNQPLYNDSGIRRNDEISKLRQTVSNSTSWQYRNLAPSSSNLPKKDEMGEKLALKNKIESEYLEIKSKFASKHHSRNTSKTEELLQIEPILVTERSANSRTPNKTPRVSQDKILRSTLNKDRSMNLTDPTNSYSQLTLSRKVGSKSAELKIEDFQLGACKGEGRFGKVYPAIHKKSGFLLGIKKVAKEAVRLMIDQFVQEIKINLFLSHPNVVRTYGCFADRQNIYIMMEYMEEGSLYRLVKLAKKFKEEQTSTKLYEICDAVRYLHSQDILHRDIKPENIVLSNGVCKLCDFGWATYSRDRRTTYCGTLDYVCPQILEGESYDNFVDIWAIGVLAYEMLVGKAPFYHISRKQTMKSIMNCQFSIPNDLSMGAKLFIMKALQKKPDQRFAIDSLLKDRFLAGSGYN